MLNDQERQRYQRHLQLPGFSEAGQLALKNAHVCIVGLGGLGCPAALYLAAAGVGRLTLVDGDSVSLSNLQRQILFTETDIGAKKVTAARAHLIARNSSIAVDAIEKFLDLPLAEALIAEVDLVLDCTDNFHTRYLINDLCHFYAKPWVYASILGFRGQIALFQPRYGCFRCLFPELSEQPDCNQAGVLGVVPGQLGTLQALIALKYLAGIEREKSNILYNFSGVNLALNAVKLSLDPACPLCSGSKNYQSLIADYQPQCSSMSADMALPAGSFTRYLETSQPQLIDVRNPLEHAVGNLGGINIPLGQLDDVETVLTDKRQPLLVYCQSGGRSAQAATILKNLGFEYVKSLAGGIEGQDGGKAR